MLEDKSNSQQAIKSFHENLIQRLGPYEGRALDALGQDFFYLVDQLSAKLHEKHPKDAPLLDLDESEFSLSRDNNYVPKKSSTTAMTDKQFDSNI